MTGVFEVLASTDAEAQERKEGNRAIIASQTRAKARFEKFVKNATSEDDTEARLGLIESNLRDLVAEVVEEHGGDPEIVYLATTAVLGGGHASDCGCGFCENKGKGFGKSDDDSDDEDDDKDDDKDDKESSVKVACSSCECDDEDCDCSEDNNCGHKGCKFAKADKLSNYHLAEVETGDSYQSETLDLGSTSGDEPWSDKGSPEIDKGKSGDEAGWSLDPIDVDSKRHQLEKQDITERVDHKNPDFDPSSPVREEQAADKSVSPPNTDGTKTWTGTEGQADPVTSKLHNWTVIEG